jgi:arylsulfatase
MTTFPQLILLFVTDQFRHDAFHPWITSHLYQLSLDDNAMTFTNAYSSTPTCTPARASLLTGKSPWNHGMLGFGASVNCHQYPTTLPGSLSQYGHYETYTVGKNHYGYDFNTQSYNNHSFDHLMLYEGKEGFERTKYNGTDDYTKYYHTLHPNQDPLDVTCHHLDYNDWMSCPYGSPREEEHPTK